MTNPFDKFDAPSGNPFDQFDAPPPSLWDRTKEIASDVGDFYKRAGEYRDTQLMRALGSVAGLPKIIGDAIHWGGEKAGLEPSTMRLLPFGSLGNAAPRMRTGEQLTSDFRKAFPVGEERSINPLVDNTVQAAFSGPILGFGGRLGPLINMGSAAASEGAGELAGDQAPEYELPARIGGALVGAGGGAGVGAVVGRIPRVVKAAIEPFTASGRDALVGRALTGAASDAPAAARALERYEIGRTAFPESVPGFRLNVGTASRDPGLMQLAEVAAAKNPGMRAQFNANNEATAKALDGLAPGAVPADLATELTSQSGDATRRAQAALDALPPGMDAPTAGLKLQGELRDRYDALIGARKAAADPLYAEARNSTTPVNPWDLMTSTADLLGTTKGAPKSLVQSVRDLLFTPEGTPDRTAAGMMATRSAVSDMLDNPQLGNYSRSLLQDFKGKINDALSVVPAEQQARQVFAQKSVPLEPFEASLGNKNVAAAIEKDTFGKDFLMEPDLVPKRFFQPGEAGGAAMREFLETKPSESARTAMQSYIAERARAGDPEAFLKQYGPAIDTLSPKLVADIRDAAKTRANADYWGKSPAAPFISADLDAAISSTLGKPDATKRIQALRMQVGNNPAAVAGFQKAIIDDFKKAATSSVQQDTAGNPRMLASGANRWLQNNAGAVSNVLTPEQLGVLREISSKLTDQAQTVPGRVGSPTYDRLATESIIGALMHPGLSKLPIFHIVNKGLGLAYGGANEATMNRLYEVMADPAMARALMMKATPGNVQMMEPILSRIGAATAVNSLNRPGGRE